MIRQNIFGEVEPECGHLREDRTFMGNAVFQYVVKGGNTIGRNHDDAVADIVHFTYFAGFIRFVFLHDFASLYITVF